MQKIITTIFDFLAVGFDKIPVLNKFKGYRSVLGFIGLAIVKGLAIKGLIGTDLESYLNAGFSSLTILALNAKGREWKSWYYQY